MINIKFHPWHPEPPAYAVFSDVDVIIVEVTSLIRRARLFTSDAYRKIDPLGAARAERKIEMYEHDLKQYKMVKLLLS